MKIKGLIYSALATVLIIIGSYIKIPLPFIPITLQTIMIYFIAIILKPKVAILSNIIYIILGLIGIPIFANGGGLGYIFDKSFGYLVGFIFATIFISRLVDGDSSIIKLAIVNIIGAIIIYFFGMIHLYIIANYYLNINMSIKMVIYYGFLTTIWLDIIKIAIAIIFARLVKKLIH